MGLGAVTPFPFVLRGSPYKVVKGYVPSEGTGLNRPQGSSCKGWGRNSW